MELTQRDIYTLNRYRLQLTTYIQFFLNTVRQKIFHHITKDLTYGPGHSCISNRMIILQVFWVKRNCRVRFRYHKKTVVIVNVVFVQQLSCLLKRSVRPYKFVKCTFVSRKININPPADHPQKHVHVRSNLRFHN